MAKQSSRPAARVPDRKAPRFRKSIFSIVNEDFIKEFLEEHPQYSGMKEFSSISLLKKLITNFNFFLCKHVVNYRDGIDLPERLGVVFVGGRTSIYNPVDYGMTNKLGKEVKTTNLETNGVIGKIFYSKHSRNHGITVRTIWKFLPYRGFTKLVAQAFKENYNRFIRVENKRQLEILFEQRNRKRKPAEKVFVPDNYNEFE